MPDNLSNDLYLELTGNDKFETECIHVTDLLKNEYKDSPEQSAFIRGKLYHYAIESLLKNLERKGKLKIVELESPKMINYTVKNRQFKVCFTPDVIINKDNKNILVEIKTSVKSRDYAILQTSIYKHLLETFFNRKIDECVLLTGDLQEFKIHCDADVGKQILEDRLGNSLLLFF